MTEYETMPIGTPIFNARDLAEGKESIFKDGFQAFSGGNPVTLVRAPKDMILLEVGAYSSAVHKGDLLQLYNGNAVDTVNEERLGSLVDKDGKPVSGEIDSIPYADVPTLESSYSAPCRSIPSCGTQSPRRG